MSGRSWWDHPLIERFRYYLRVVWAWQRRATRLGLAIRVLVWVTGAAGLVLALAPLAAAPVIAPVALLAALLPAGYPAGRWPTLLLVAAIVGLSVGLRLVPPERPLPLVAAVAVLLYLHHAVAGLAAQVRTDVVVPARLLWRWAQRTALALVTAAVVGLLVSVAPVPAWSATGHLALAALAAVIVTGALVWSARRPGDPVQR